MAIYIGYNMDSNSSLSHHGVKGMHWGVRNYQNLNGSLTDLGYIHYYGHARRERQRGYVIDEIVKDKNFQEAVSAWNSKTGSREIAKKLRTYIAAVKATKKMGLKGQDRRDVIKMITEEARVKSISTVRLSQEEKDDYERLIKNHLDVDKVKEFSDFIRHNIYSSRTLHARTEEMKELVAKFFKEEKPVYTRSGPVYSVEQNSKFVRLACSEILKELGYKPTTPAVRYIAPLVFDHCYYDTMGGFYFIGLNAARLGSYL